ncbi:MAG: putative Ig domain-containing protein [Leptospiraceae bacterium]|nr:putative Ig domain-containing protein [Leptospiraceae bacterium]MCP5494949.1 putative Ig domain-containing protein [Leptospiraceae bacterium]
MQLKNAEIEAIYWSISLWPNNPSNLKYSESDSAYYVGTKITGNLPSYDGSVSSFSVLPNLPSGISINSTSGIISGTPTIESSATVYTITASSEDGSTSSDVTITVALTNSSSTLPPSDTATSPSNLVYTGSPFTFIQGQPIPTITPTVTGTITSCTSSPAMPSGLVLSPTTCVISGTPTTTLAPTSFTITASNPGGSTTANITITINELPVFTSRATSLTWNYVALSETGEYQIAVYDDGVYFSDDYGTTWTSKVYYNGSYNIRGAAISANGQYSLTSSYAQPSYRSDDYGTIWNIISGLDSNKNYCGMSTDGKYQMIVSVSLDKIYISSNYGVSWTQNYSSTGDVRGAAIAGTGQYQIATDGGLTYFYSGNYGASGSWAPYTLSITNVGIFTASMSDSGQYVLLNGFGGVLLSTSGASNPNNFSEIMSDSGIWYCGAVSSTGQSMVAAKKNGNIYISYDYGTSWITVDSIGTKAWNAISISRDGTHITVAENPGFIYTAVINP